MDGNVPEGRVSPTLTVTMAIYRRDVLLILILQVELFVHVARDQRTGPITPSAFPRGNLLCFWPLQSPQPPTSFVSLKLT